MKLFWLTLLSAVMFASCAPQKARMDMIFTDQETVPMVEESVVKVAVLPNNLAFLDLSRWGKPESQLSPQDRLMRDIEQLIELERRERFGDQPSSREAQLLGLKGAITTGLAHSEALEKFAAILLEMEETAAKSRAMPESVLPAQADSQRFQAVEKGAPFVCKGDMTFYNDRLEQTAQEGACQRQLLEMQVGDPRERRERKEAILSYYAIMDDPLAVYRLVEELCDKIEQEAWRKAFKSLLRDFMMKSLVLQPSDRSDQEGIFHAGSQLTGYCQPLRDEFSGKFTHDVRFEATLLPLRRFAGVIDVLHDDYTMAGMGSRVYVSLTDPTDLSAPLPVLIVQWQEGLKPGFVKVVGSGVITQIFGSQGQMEILESTKEIVAGDMFFVLQAKGRLVQDRSMKAPYSPGMWRGIPAVTVRPGTK